MRGRRLLGKEIALPEGYEGVVVKDKGVALPSGKQRSCEIVDLDDENEIEEEVEVRMFEEVGSFDNVMLWDHEKVAEGDDAFVKGLSEWIGFAEGVW